MRKLFKLISFCSILFLGLGLATQTWANNLLINPGFENGLNNWTDLYGAPSWVSTNIVHTGTMAAAKTIDNVTNDYWSQLYQEVPYSAGQAFYVTMWAKTDISPVSGAKAGLIVHFLNSSGQIIGTPLQSQIGGQTDWRLLYVSGTTPTNTTKIRVSCFVWAGQGDTLAVGGNCYYDDAVLSSEYIAPPPPQTALINPGFENGRNDWTDLYGYPSAVSSTIVHSGNYAANKTIMDVTSQSYWSQLYQELVAVPGRSFSARLWVKTNMNPASSAQAGVLVQFLNSSGIVIGPRFIQHIGGQTDWQQLTVSGVVPAGAVKARFNCYIWAAQGDLAALGGVAYYDDAYAGRPGGIDIEP